MTQALAHWLWDFQLDIRPIGWCCRLNNRLIQILIGGLLTCTACCAGCNGLCAHVADVNFHTVQKPPDDFLQNTDKSLTKYRQMNWLSSGLCKVDREFMDSVSIMLGCYSVWCVEYNTHWSNSALSAVLSAVSGLSKKAEAANTAKHRMHCIALRIRFGDTCWCPTWTRQTLNSLNSQTHHRNNLNHFC